MTGMWLMSSHATMIINTFITFHDRFLAFIMIWNNDFPLLVVIIILARFTVILWEPCMYLRSWPLLWHKFVLKPKFASWIVLIPTSFKSWFFKSNLFIFSVVWNTKINFEYVLNWRCTYCAVIQYLKHGMWRKFSLKDHIHST